MICLPGGLRVERQDRVMLFRAAETDGAAGKTGCGRTVQNGAAGQTYGDSDRCISTAGDIPDDCIYLHPGTQQIGNLCVQVEFFERKDGIPQEIFKENKYTKCLSCDTIVSDVCFRKRQTRDYLVINAQGGRKKLKDYMIDQKIPRDRRDDIWLVADGSHVLWLPGYRISEAARVTEDTERVMKITITIQKEEDCL
jgi:tRNA(Ile)-lysidine synthase